MASLPIRNWLPQRLLIGALFFALLVAACGRDWDRFDPRLAASVGGGSGVGGMSQGGGEPAVGGNAVVTSTASSGGGGEGGVGGATAPCGGVTAFQDDFDDDVVDPRWSAGGVMGGVVEDKGVLSLLLPANSLTFAQTNGVFAYDMRGRAVSVELVKAPSAPDEIASRLVVAADLGQFCEWSLEGDQLVARYSNAGGSYDVMSLMFDGAQHRWWRIREEQSVIYWETSADGMQWDSRSMGVPLADVGFPISHIHTVLYAQRSAPGSAADGPIFDNYNTQEKPEANCLASSFDEDFSAATLGRGWFEWTSNGCMSGVVAGTYVFELQSGVTTSCGVETTRRFDLRDDRVTVKLAAAHSSDDQVSAELVAYRSAEELLVLRHAGKNLRGRVFSTGGNDIVFNVPFVANDYVYWSLREKGGFIMWETSKDGQGWEEHAAVAAPFPVDDVMIYLRANAALGATANTVAFDDYNL